MGDYCRLRLGVQPALEGGQDAQGCLSYTQLALCHLLGRFACESLRFGCFCHPGSQKPQASTRSKLALAGSQGYPISDSARGKNHGPVSCSGAPQGWGHRLQMR